MKNKITYSQAINELEAIVSEIENEDIGVDELSEKVQRASELIKFCKDKLHKTGEEVSAVLKDLESGEEG